MSFDRLIDRILALQNPTVAGLDPNLSLLPQSVLDAAFAAHGQTLEGAAAAVLAFNRRIIDALCDVVPAVKPQCAYYEQLGWPGCRALAETIRYAQQKGMFVITDGKRNDIGPTMEAYANAHLGIVAVGDSVFSPFGADALTVNGYLGTDGIRPLLDVCERQDKGIFVLVKTSNPSASELQDRPCDGQTVYEVMGEFCESWGTSRGKYGFSCVGAVVGATWPGQLADLRAALPHTFFLIPGYGAQGGGGSDAAAGFDARGLGAVVNASRSILYAWRKTGDEDFARAARNEALRMRDDLRKHLPPFQAGV